MSPARAASGVLLALAGDDASHVRAIDADGTGLVVVRRCGDVAELLSAALAGLARLAVVSAELDDVDLTVLDRLTRAGTRGVLLVADPAPERWSPPGWQVLDAGTEPAQVRAALQALSRQEQAAPGAGDGVAAGGTSAPADAGGAGAEQETTQSRPAGAGPWPAGAGSWPADDGAEGVVPQPAGAGGSPAGFGATGGGGAASTAPAPPPTLQDLAGARAASGGLVVVWGPHGAPGRSTVAASLATGLAGAGPTILVDADTEAPSLAQALSLPDDSAALATAARLASRSRLDPESFAALLVPLRTQVSVLPGLGRSGRWRELPPVAMSRVWECCREHAAWTVVDICGGLPEDEVDPYTLEPGHGALAAALLREADVIVVVGGADPVGIRRLLQLLSDAAEDASVSGRIEVVVNRVRASAAGPSPERAVREALARFGGLEEAVLLPQDEAADASLMTGLSVLDGAPASPLGRGLAVLVDRVDPAAGARSRASSARRAGWRVWGRAAARTSAPVAPASGQAPPPPSPAAPEAGAAGDPTRQDARRPGARRRRGGRHRG